MKVVEILGDSVREDLNFVADKIKDLPEGKTVYFVFENLRDLVRLKEAPAFSRIEIDTENENRYKIFVKNVRESAVKGGNFSEKNQKNGKITKKLRKSRKNPEIYFILSKNLKNFNNIDYLFLVDLEKFEDVKKKAEEKLFLLTDREHETEKLKEIREKNYKNLKIIQLGLPESWVEF